MRLVLYTMIFFAIVVNSIVKLLYIAVMQKYLF